MSDADNAAAIERIDAYNAALDRVAELEAIERELQAQLDAAVASIADWCRGHNASGSDGPCDCSACRALANLPAAAREHLARDAEREQALRELATGECEENCHLVARRALEPPNA